jgi:hypothetical protein
MKMIYCDNCGEPESEDTGSFVRYADLPFDVASVHAGESGVVCDICSARLFNKKVFG